jgi:DNA-binding MarR family transcriptional regulator
MFEKDFIIIYGLIGQIIRTHKEMLFSDQELSQLTLHQIDYLKRIHELKAPTLGQLARSFKITKPSVTAIVQHLSDMGYLDKIQSQDDLRVFTVKLTPKGERLVRVDEEALHEFCSQMRSVLNQSEVDELSFLLAKLVTTLNSKPAPDFDLKTTR